MMGDEKVQTTQEQEETVGHVLRFQKHSCDQKETGREDVVTDTDLNDEDTEGHVLRF